MVESLQAAQQTRRLGELLAARRLLTRAQLEQSLKRQLATKEFLGTILIQMKLISPEALLEALSDQFRMPHQSLSAQDVDWDTVLRFPASALADGRCLPIRADDESVTVALANPLDAWTLSGIEKLAGLRIVKPVLVLERELQEVMRIYRQRLAATLTSDRDDDGDHDSD